MGLAYLQECSQELKVQMISSNSSLESAARHMLSKKSMRRLHLIKHLLKSFTESILEITVQLVSYITLAKVYLRLIEWS